MYEEDYAVKPGDVGEADEDWDGHSAASSSLVGETSRHLLPLPKRARISAAAASSQLLLGSSSADEHDEEADEQDAAALALDAGSAGFGLPPALEPSSSSTTDNEAAPSTPPLSATEYYRPLFASVTGLVKQVAQATTLFSGLELDDADDALDPNDPDLGPAAVAGGRANDFKHGIGDEPDPA